MAEILTISIRRISGTGLILLSSADMNYRRYTLFADIIRKPRTPYLNTNSSPPKTFYGVISLMKNDYVVQTYKIEFDAQIYTFDADITGQAINTIKCVYDGILVSFENLGTALGLTVISVENDITLWKNLPLQWDSIRVQCFGDCAIQLVLKGLKYDFCEADDEIPGPPPTPPAKPTSVSPGVATNISPAYTNDTLTAPAPIDLTFVPPPIGNQCQQYSVLVQYNNTLNQPVQEVRPFYGPIGRVRSVPNGSGSRLEIECRGIGNQGCKPFTWYTFTTSNNANGLQNPFIISIT